MRRIRQGNTSVPAESARARRAHCCECAGKARDCAGLQDHKREHGGAQPEAGCAEGEPPVTDTMILFLLIY